MTLADLTRIEEFVQDPPQLIRVGDRVLVTKPEFVTRVGYPMSFADAIEWVKVNKWAEIDNVLTFTRHPYKAFRDQVERAVARSYLKCCKYGGPERKIHTRHVDEELGKIHTVSGKRTVKTGKYYSPSGSGEDWEPGGLDNAKSHVLLCLDFWVKDFGALNGTIDDQFAFGMWIERCNVKLYKEI